jgi:hypothetical protein
MSIYPTYTVNSVVRILFCWLSSFRSMNRSPNDPLRIAFLHPDLGIGKYILEI